LFRRAFEQASWYLDRALARCPNDADLLIQLAHCEVLLGRPEIGVAHAAKAMRFNPCQPNLYSIHASIAHLHAGEIETACTLGACVDGIPFVDAPAYVAIAHALGGRLAEAQRLFETYRAAFRERITFGREPAPGEAVQWMLSINPYRREQDVALLREALRMLGEAAEPPMLPSLGDEIEPDGPALRRAGEGWVVDYQGRRAMLPDLKGLADIRRLLERPGEELHCLDLAERADDACRGAAVLDDAARQVLKGRIRDLQEELAEAEDMNDPGRAERARRARPACGDAGEGARPRRARPPARRCRRARAHHRHLAHPPRGEAGGGGASGTRPALRQQPAHRDVLRLSARTGGALAAGRAVVCAGGVSLIAAPRQERCQPVTTSRVRRSRRAW
jgi:hypothetical protein